MTETEQEGASVAPREAPPPSTVKKRCSCWKILFWTGAVVVGIAAVLGGYLYKYRQDRDIPRELYETMGLEGVQMFISHDRDGDGYLSIQEYESLYYRIVGKNPNMSFAEEVYEQPIEDYDYMVTIETNFKPLDQSTMTKDFDEEASFLSYGELDALEGLNGWTTTNKEWMNMAVRHFAPFLPPESLYQAVGEVYFITQEQTSAFSIFNGDLSSNRYFPPHVPDNYITIHRLLAMFHKRPFIMNRFQPRGGVAVIRAKNDKYLDIVFRIHAEFQLNDPPNHPFWFTPGQFTGHLVISKDLKEILHFNMYVPADRRLNVDMEWLQGDRGMEVDIGYMPEMSMTITGPSMAVKAFDVNQKVSKQIFDLDTIQWNKEIPLEKALSDLEVKLYPFKKALKKDSTQPEMSAVASHILAHYKFPVMMMVMHPNGTVIEKINANDYLDEAVDNSLFGSHTEAYVSFLQKGITKAEAGLVAEITEPETDKE